MSDINPVGSSTPAQQVSLDAAKVADTYTPEELENSHGWASFQEFLGKKDFAEFQKNLCQQIANQIGRDQKRAQAASDQLKKSETGENIYD